ncbi:MAG: hypothetical protein FWG57_09245 [Endomicrobia bacterium]|nr:hypothetical protein [Endomicrobiia bacterium]
MKDSKLLNKEEKKEVCIKRFEEGKSTKELAREYVKGTFDSAKINCQLLPL